MNPVPDYDGDQQARSAEADVLKSPRAKRMNLVSKESFGPIIRRAVMRACERYQNDVSGRILFGLRAAVERELLSGIRGEGRHVRGMTKKDFLAELARSRNRIVLDSRDAAAELERVKVELVRKRRAREERATSEQFIREAEARDGALAAKIREVFGQEGGDSGRLLDRTIETAVQALVEERRLLCDRQGREEDVRIDMLERRINKLNASLEAAEELIQRMAALKDIDPGIASLYRSVQGLSLEDAQLELKREMLSDIFKSNLSMQTELRAAG